MNRKIRKCPYCKSRVSYLEALTELSSGEHTCPVCNKNSNISFQKTIYLPAAVMLALSLIVAAMFFLFKIITNIILALVLILVPFAVFYFLTPLFYTLEAIKSEAQTPVVRYEPKRAARAEKQSRTLKSDEAAKKDYSVKEKKSIDMKNKGESKLSKFIKTYIVVPDDEEEETTQKSEFNSDKKNEQKDSPDITYKKESSTVPVPKKNVPEPIYDDISENENPDEQFVDLETNRKTAPPPQIKTLAASKNENNDDKPKLNFGKLFSKLNFNTEESLNKDVTAGDSPVYHRLTKTTNVNFIYYPEKKSFISVDIKEAQKAKEPAAENIEDAEFIDIDIDNEEQEVTAEDTIGIVVEKTLEAENNEEDREILNFFSAAPTDSEEHGFSSTESNAPLVNVTEENSNILSENVPEENSDTPSESVSEENSDTPSENVPEENNNTPSENVSAENIIIHPEKIPEETGEISDDEEDDELEGWAEYTPETGDFITVKLDEPAKKKNKKKNHIIELSDVSFDIENEQDNQEIVEEKMPAAEEDFIYEAEDTLPFIDVKILKNQDKSRFEMFSKHFSKIKNESVFNLERLAKSVDKVMKDQVRLGEATETPDDILEFSEELPEDGNAVELLTFDSNFSDEEPAGVELISHDDVETETTETPAEEPVRIVDLVQSEPEQHNTDLDIDYLPSIDELESFEIGEDDGLEIFKPEEFMYAEFSQNDNNSEKDNSEVKHIITENDEESASESEDDYYYFNEDDDGIDDIISESEDEDTAENEDDYYHFDETEDETPEIDEEEKFGENEDYYHFDESEDEIPEIDKEEKFGENEDYYHFDESEDNIPEIDEKEKFGENEDYHHFDESEDEIYQIDDKEMSGKLDDIIPENDVNENQQLLENLKTDDNQEPWVNDDYYHFEEDDEDNEDEEFTEAVEGAIEYIPDSDNDNDDSFVIDYSDEEDKFEDISSGEQLDESFDLEKFRAENSGENLPLEPVVPVKIDSSGNRIDEKPAQSRYEKKFPNAAKAAAEQAAAMEIKKQKEQQKLKSSKSAKTKKKSSAAGTKTKTESSKLEKKHPEQKIPQQKKSEQKQGFFAGIKSRIIEATEEERQAVFEEEERQRKLAEKEARRKAKEKEKEKAKAREEKEKIKTSAGVSTAKDGYERLERQSEDERKKKSQKTKRIEREKVRIPDDIPADGKTIVYDTSEKTNDKELKNHEQIIIDSVQDKVRELESRKVTEAEKVKKITEKVDEEKRREKIERMKNEQEQQRRSSEKKRRDNQLRSERLEKAEEIRREQVRQVKKQRDEREKPQEKRNPDSVSLKETENVRSKVSQKKKKRKQEIDEVL